MPKTCRRCATSLPEEAVFCGQCGEKSIPPENACPHCGAEILPMASRCGSCKEIIPGRRGPASWEPIRSAPDPDAPHPAQGWIGAALFILTGAGWLVTLLMASSLPKGGSGPTDAGYGILPLMVFLLPTLVLTLSLAGWILSRIFRLK